MSDAKLEAAKKQWREMTVDLGPFKPFDGPLIKRPHNRHETIAMFGNPANSDDTMDTDWKHRNITDLHEVEGIPFTDHYYFGHNRQLTPYFTEFFRRCEIGAPGYVTKAGGHNFRRMRGDTPGRAEKRNFHPPLRDLSEHAFGTAADLMDHFNKAIEGWNIFRFLPWSPQWMARWKNGVPRIIVQAGLSCGFSWGGFWNGFCDPMHFQFCGQSEVQV